VVGNYAYATGYNSGSLAIIDISTPSSLSIVGHVSDARLGGARDLHVVGNLLMSQPKALTH